jgi:predicted transcriptional regulator YdeE
MEPFLIQKPEITLVGMSFYGNPFDTHRGWDEGNEIGRVWVRFMAYLDENGEVLQNVSNPGVYHEVHVYNQETITKGIFEVFVGVQVDDLDGVPVELLVKILPSSDYAVFTLKGEEISADWHMKIDRWIEEAGYQRAYPYSFQYYDERFKGVQDLANSVLDVYMPVKRITAKS